MQQALIPQQVAPDDEQPKESSRDIFALCFLAKAEDVRQVCQRIANLQDQARDYRRMFAESDDPTTAGLDFMKTKCNKSRTRSRLLNNL